MKCVECSEVMVGCAKCTGNDSCSECNIDLILNPLTRRCLMANEGPIGYYAN